MREELIEKVSKLYKSQYEKAKDVERKMLHVKKQLSEESKNLSHYEYKKLERRLALYKNDYEVELWMAKGMFLAREELLE